MPCCEGDLLEGCASRPLADSHGCDVGEPGSRLQCGEGVGGCQSEVVAGDYLDVNGHDLPEGLDPLVTGEGVLLSDDVLVSDTVGTCIDGSLGEVDEEGQVRIGGVLRDDRYVESVLGGVGCDLIDLVGNPCVVLSELVLDEVIGCGYGYADRVHIALDTPVDVVDVGPVPGHDGCSEAHAGDVPDGHLLLGTEGGVSCHDLGDSRLVEELGDPVLLDVGEDDACGLLSVHKCGVADAEGPVHDLIDFVLAFHIHPLTSLHAPLTVIKFGL